MPKRGHTARTSVPRRRASLEIEPKPRGTPEISTFDRAEAYLRDRVDLERIRVTSETRHEYKLDRMRAMLAALGNPQESVRCVHIAGTKGKGSTCEMTACSLEACGYTVGLFTSPHLCDVRERIRLNRRPISQEDFTGVIARVAQASAEAGMGEPTFFEVLTAAGFLYFAEQAVDVGVIEVGLGGLLDCTNVITPEVAAITTIGHDHTQILGSTLAEIAAQKAGIFKPGVPALTVEQEESALEAIRRVAGEVGAPLQVVGTDIEYSFRFEWQAGDGPSARVSLTSDRCNYEHVPVPLKGEHQAVNCGLALAILDKLTERGFHCPEDRVLRGLESTRLPGRFEEVGQSPRVVLDCAHNPESIRALMKALGAYVQFDSLVVLFGCAADKDIDSMLRALASGGDKVIFTRATGNPRSANPSDLARRYAEISGGKVAQVAQTFADGLELARRALDRGDALCITGSFYIVGEAKQILAQREAAKAAGRRA
ncbi:MAG: folylpolyglutamate synthase/dihydrofolate synthase family protein [Phycisphaerales bacterium]